MAELTIRCGKFLQISSIHYINIDQIIGINYESSDRTEIVFHNGTDIRRTTIYHSLQDIINLLEKECSNTKHIKKWK
jgi:hypothetical protein